MNGFILYKGPSKLDGNQIVAIVIGLDGGARNSKTGPIPQIYFLREDVAPIAAAQTGADISICGDCRHRGRVITDPKTGNRKNVERSCYVTLMHGPNVVYQAYKRGAYKEVPLQMARKFLAGRLVRVGAYGDPGSVPFEVLETALDKAQAVNGYTHLWREYPQLSAFCMASCDTEIEREEAKALGFRTFRVRTKDAPVLKGEGKCPASAELGKPVQCVQCMLCGGKSTGAKADITIQVHGAGAGHYSRALALA